MLSEEFTIAYIVVAGILGLAYGLFNALCLTKIQVGEGDFSSKYSTLNNDPKYLASLIDTYNEKRTRTNSETGEEEEYEEVDIPHYQSWDEVVAALKHIASAVTEGATTFLMEEYKILAIFIVLFGATIALLVEEELGEFWTTGAFVLGSVISILSGYIGMKAAVYTNSRTAYSAINQ